jgi:ribosomal protein S6
MTTQLVKVTPAHDASTNVESVTEVMENRGCEITNVEGWGEYQFEEVLRKFCIGFLIFSMRL